MKVLLVHNYYQHSGGEDEVFRLEKKLLERKGHDVATYTVSNQAISNLSKLSLGAASLWSTRTQHDLNIILKKNKPDIAHFHNTFPLISPSAYYACNQAGVKVVQTLHNYRLFCPSSTHFYREGRICEICLGKTPPWPGIKYSCYRESRLETAVLTSMLTLHRWLKTWERRVNVYIALTEFARRKFIEGGLPAEKIIVKPNAVYLDPGSGVGNGKYALFVGRISVEKGINTLLTAWRHLPGILIRIIGDGPLLEDVHMFITQYKLRNVEVLGSCEHDEVFNLMKGARFLIFPSEWYEGFPMTIVEAFACGLPVIASRLGSMEEIVDDRRTGLHFNPGDPDDLAAQVEWAWTHPREMVEMGLQARKEFEKKYTAERNYELLMEIYKDTLSRGKIA